MKSNGQPFTGKAFESQVLAEAAKRALVRFSDFDAIRAACGATSKTLPDGGIDQILQDADIRVWRE